MESSIDPDGIHSELWDLRLQTKCNCSHIGLEEGSLVMRDVCFFLTTMNLSLFRLEQWNRCVCPWPWHWKNSNRIVTMPLRCVPCQLLIVLVRSVNRRQSSQEIHPFNHSIRVNYSMSPLHSRCWRNSTERHPLDPSILCLRLYIGHFSSTHVYLCI